MLRSWALSLSLWRLEQAVQACSCEEKARGTEEMRPYVCLKALR